MGIYITENELKSRYKVFETTKNFNVNSDGIFYAEKEVESRLSSVYSVPFSEAYPTVKDLCIDMVYARWMRMNDTKNGEKIYKVVSDRLDRIVSGDDPIITTSGTLEPSAGGADLPESTTENYSPTHSMLGAESSAEGIDPDRLQDERDERI